MLQFAISMLLVFENTLHLSGTNSCPSGQVDHHIPATKELRCCLPIKIEIGYEFIPCLKNGTSDTRKKCGPREYQPDEGSSLNEYICYDEKVALNCDTEETIVITNGSQKKCICNTERGHCGLDYLLCHKIELSNCPGHKADQDCRCIQSTIPPTVTTEEKRPINTTTSGTITHITNSLQVPTRQVHPVTDEKKPDIPQVTHEEDEVNNKEVQENGTSNNWPAYLGIIAAVIIFVGTVVISSYCIWRRRRSRCRQIAEYICTQEDGQNSVSMTIETSSVDGSGETISETDSEQTQRKQVRNKGGGNNSDANIPLLRSPKSKDSSRPVAVVPHSSRPVAVVPPTIMPTEFSSAPACPTSDVSATTQDPGNPASVHFVEELPRPEFHSIPCPPLFTGSFVSTDVNRISGEVIRAPQAPEINVAQLAGEPSEVSPSREVSLTQETREITAAGAANARMPSDFGHTNSGQIQQMTKGNAITLNGGATVRAELPSSVLCLEGNKTQDPENTELKVVKQETAANSLQRTSLMDGAGISFANGLSQCSIRNELEPQSLAQIDDASNILNLVPESVVSDPSLGQPKESENNETSNIYQTLMIADLPHSVSAHSLDSDEDQNMNRWSGACTVGKNDL